MIPTGVWIGFYMLLGIFLMVLLIHLIVPNLPYIHKYRVTRIMTALLVPLTTLNIIWFVAEAILLFQHRPTFLPFILSQIASLLFTSVLSTLTVILLAYKGKNWVMRRKHGRNKFFGPYLCFGKDSTTSMHVQWGCPKKYQKKFKVFKLGLSQEDLTPIKEKIQSNSLIQYVILDKLKPNTKYYYQIPPKSKIFTFQTAPSAENDSQKGISFEFAAVSDMHGSGNPIGKTVNLIQTRVNDAKFLLSSGDNVSDARILTHWRTLWGQLYPISPSIPFLSCPGNHDGELPQSKDIWTEIFQYTYPNVNEGLYYSTIYFNTAIFFLDLYSAGRTEGIPKKEQVEWLEKELSELSPSIEHKIIVFHNAFYTTGDFGCDPDLNELFLPLIKKYHVQTVLNGHSHIFEVFDDTGINSPTGTRFIVTGGGGARNDYCVIRWFSDTPYKWKSKTHIASENPYFEGQTDSRYRNDEYVLKYQKIGKLTHQILRFKVEGKKLTLQCIEWDGNVLYERSYEND
jgi:calcineurin-like phosphoesterase family protein